MNLDDLVPPDLSKLKQADSSEWEVTFRWLWPTAYAVCRDQLYHYAPDEIEDVAIESVRLMVEKVSQIKQIEELKAILASTAHNQSVSLLRKRFAQKRGSGKTESLESVIEDEAGMEPAYEDSMFGNMETQELGQLIEKFGEGLKPVVKLVIDEFYMNDLSYKEIAQKHDIALGTVCTHLKRGLLNMREQIEKNPTLLKEAEAFLR